MVPGTGRDPRLDRRQQSRAGPVFALSGNTAMDPLDPADAQQIVIQYARVLERDIAESRHPARVDSLPFARPVIKTAIRTSVTHLAESGLLTEDLRDYLEAAYTSLAEYLDDELVTLMTKYRQSAEDLVDQPIGRHERTGCGAWQMLTESSTLAGEIARNTTAEAENLRSEFQSFLVVR